MHALFSQSEFTEVATCVAGYGSALNGNVASLDFGINRICQQFKKLCDNELRDSPYVFAVIVDKIRNDNVEGRTGIAADALTKIHVDNLMEELRKKIPVTYLHIPQTFQFILDGRPITFNHWQSECLSLIPLRVSFYSLWPIIYCAAP